MIEALVVAVILVVVFAVLIGIAAHNGYVKFRNLFGETLTFSS